MSAGVVHIRRQLRRSRSTNFYLDRSDRGRGTYCGEPETDRDQAYAGRHWRWTKENACPACLESVAIEDGCRAAADRRKENR